MLARYGLGCCRGVVHQVAAGLAEIAVAGHLVQNEAADADHRGDLRRGRRVALAEGRTQAALAFAATALVEHGVLGAQQIEVVQDLNDGDSGGTDLVPGRYRPSGQVVAEDHVGPFAGDHLAHMLAHAAVVTVAVVPAQAQQRVCPGLGVVPVEVVQAGAIDPYAVVHLFVQPGFRACDQYRHVAAAVLKTFGQLAHDDFRATAHMGNIQAV